METITLAEQIKASRAMYEKAVENIDVLSDAELRNLLANCSVATIDRVVANCSAATIDRVQLILSTPVPIVENLDALVLAEAEAGNVEMSTWHHACGTTHCRSGTAVHLAGEAGYALERAVGYEAAGRMIYEASTGRPAPNFYASNEDAIADIRRCAALVKEAALEKE
jgi:hypothetical protein